MEGKRKNKYGCKTPGGLTDRQEMLNSVLQGDTWGPFLAAVQVDSIAYFISFYRLLLLTCDLFAFNRNGVGETKPSPK